VAGAAAHAQHCAGALRRRCAPAVFAVDDVGAGRERHALAVAVRRARMRHWRGPVPAREAGTSLARTVLAWTGTPKSAGVEGQGGLGVDRAFLDFADENHMVAFRIATAVVAFEPGADALQDRLAGARQHVIGVGERIFA